MFGYPTNDDYYRDASPVHRLKSVQVPMLCLNAADDVFSPSHGESKIAPHTEYWFHCGAVLFISLKLQMITTIVSVYIKNI